MASIIWESLITAAVKDLSLGIDEYLFPGKDLTFILWITFLLSTIHVIATTVCPQCQKSLKLLFITTLHSHTFQVQLGLYKSLFIHWLVYARL